MLGVVPPGKNLNQIFAPRIQANPAARWSGRRKYLTDAAGRAGVGVGIVNPMLANGLDVIIFDPVTHQYLGTQLINDDGTVDFDRALVRTGVVDKVGQVPD